MATVRANNPLLPEDSTGGAAGVSEMTTSYGAVPYIVIDSGKLASLRRAVARVYLCLCGHCETVTFRCYPKQETIRRRTGLSRKSVREAIAELVELGLLIVECQGKWKSHSAHYRLAFDHVPLRTSKARRKGHPQSVPLQSQSVPLQSPKGLPEGPQRVTPGGHKNISLTEREHASAAASEDRPLRGNDNGNHLGARVCRKCGKPVSASERVSTSGGSMAYQCGECSRRDEAEAKAAYIGARP